MRLHDAERAAVRRHRTHTEIRMRKENGETHCWIHRLHDTDDALRSDDEAALGHARLRAGAQCDGEIFRATATLQRFSRNEPPLDLRAESEQLAQPVVLGLECGNARGGERQGIAPQLDALGGEVRGAPSLRALLQTHQRRDERATQGARHGLAQIGGQYHRDKRQQDARNEDDDVHPGCESRRSRHARLRCSGPTSTFPRRRGFGPCRARRTSADPRQRGSAGQFPGSATGRARG